ncbi:MAG: aminotransferase class IV, partial [Acidimicrobiia bacterium]
DGHVTESTVANVAVLIGSRWVTPPLESGCLPGVYRAELLEAKALEIAPIPLATLRTATDVALINSVRGWRRAVVEDAKPSIA